MKPEEAKTGITTFKELNESYVDLMQLIKSTSKEANTTKKLWREGNKSRLVKLGLALIVFPEPTPISETVGACLVAAGAIQKGIQRKTLYIDDVYKTFKETLREIGHIKQTV